MSDIIDFYEKKEEIRAKNDPTSNNIWKPLPIPLKEGLYGQILIKKVLPNYMLEDDISDCQYILPNSLEEIEEMNNENSNKLFWARVKDIEQAIYEYENNQTIS